MARRSVNKAIADVNTRFDLKLPLFQLTKRKTGYEIRCPEETTIKKNGRLIILPKREEG